MAKEVYTEKEIEVVLTIMQYYLGSCSKEERCNYLIELSNTGLFHDAIGKVISNNVEVIIDTEY